MGVLIQTCLCYDLLKDKADSRDNELASHLALAASRETDAERLSFHDDLNQCQGPHDEIPRWALRSQNPPV